MALLSDPARRKKLVCILERWNIPLSFLGYTAGVFWFFLLASDQFNNRVYISENALLPGSVETTYSEDHVASKFYEELKNVCNNDIYSQRVWLRQQFQLAGLEVFHQDFTCGNHSVKGENVYGILRSPRSSGVESVVLNVPQRYQCASNGAIALLLSVVQHVKFQNYWAKDIVFLVSEQDSCGVQAWLGSYHGSNLKGVMSSDLHGHAGKIQAALVLDFERDVIHGMDVLFESLNGLLPNLDLLNMVFRVGRSEGIHMKLHSQDSYYGFVDSLEDYIRCLTALCKMILWQATGFPSGVHGYYVKYRIEAITLKDSVTGQRNNEVHFGHIGRIVEGIFRSFNNLQEHFHQSFFMYLLPASERYISIALYMPVLGGILIGPFLQSISLWMQTFGKDVETTKTKSQKVTTDFFRLPLVFVCLSHSVGLLMYLALPYVLDHHPGDADARIAVEVAVGCWTVALSFGYFRPVMSEKQLMSTKLFTILYITAVVTMTSLLNFSFALLLAVPLVPMIICINVRQTTRRFTVLLKYAVVLFISPVTYVVLLSALHILMSKSEVDAKTLLEESIMKTESFLRYSIVYRYLNVWTWELMCLVVLPIWILISGLAYPL